MFTSDASESPEYDEKEWQDAIECPKNTRSKLLPTPINRAPT